MIGEIESAFALLQRVKTSSDERAFRSFLIEFLEGWILASDLSWSDKEAARKHLRNPNIRAEVLLSATPAEFKEVLRRIGVLSTDALTEEQKRLLEELSRYRFAAGASHQEKVMLDRIQDVPSQTLDLLRQELPELRMGRSERVFPRTLPSHSDSRENSINALSDSLGVNLLTPWSERLEAAFNPNYESRSDPFEDYRHLVDEAKSESQPERLEEKLENIVILCVEYEVELALARLKALEGELPPRDDKRRVIYHRLIGTLERERGAGEAAHRAYEKASGIASTFGGQHHGERWLERQLKYDLLQFLTPSDHVFDKHREMLAIPAWHEHPAVDDAVRAFDEKLSAEAFQQSLATENSFRMSTNLTEAVFYLNKALALSYLTGNYQTARDIRFYFAIHRLTLAEDTEENLKVTLTELLRSYQYSEIKSYLSPHAHRFARTLDWDEVTQTLRPHQPGAYTSRDMSLTAMAIVEVMGPYIGDSALRHLNEEFLRRTLQHLVTYDEPFVSGHNYSEFDFINAFRSIFSLTPRELRRLIGSLEDHPPNAFPSFWSLLAEHVWRDEDIESARLVVRFLTREPSGDERDNRDVPQILWRVGQHFPELRENVEDWFIKMGSEKNPSMYFSFLLDGHSLKAAPHIARWVRALADTATEELSAVTERDAVSSNEYADLALIAPAFEVYPDSFPEDFKLTTARRLFSAAQNPHIFVRTKARAFQTLAKIVGCLNCDSREVFRRDIEQRAPSAELAKTIERRGMGFAPDPLLARLRLLQLRTTLGVPPSKEDFQLVLKAFSAYVSYDQAVATFEVAETFINHHQARDTLLQSLIQYLQLGPQQVRVKAAAVRALVRCLPEDTALLFDIAAEALQNLLRTGHPYVVQSILVELIQKKDSLTEAEKRSFLPIAEELSKHPQRYVRHWALKFASTAQ